MYPNLQCIAFKFLVAFVNFSPFYLLGLLLYLNKSYSYKFISILLRVFSTCGNTMGF